MNGKSESFIKGSENTGVQDGRLGFSGVFFTKRFSQNTSRHYRPVAPVGFGSVSDVTRHRSSKPKRYFGLIDHGTGRGRWDICTRRSRRSRRHDDPAGARTVGVTVHGRCERSTTSTTPRWTATGKTCENIMTIVIIVIVNTRYNGRETSGTGLVPIFIFMRAAFNCFPSAKFPLKRHLPEIRRRSTVSPRQIEWNVLGDSTSECSCVRVWQKKKNFQNRKIRTLFACSNKKNTMRKEKPSTIVERLVFCFRFYSSFWFIVAEWLDTRITDSIPGEQRNSF